VFDLVGSDAALDSVARALGETPLLVAQLLRLANCSEQPNGKSERISSLRQALSIAGSRRLLHWCGLLLYVDRDGLPFEDDPVVLLAQRRAHFMEEAIDAMPDGSYLLAAAAYLTGMLSLLHVAYHMELHSFVDELPSLIPSGWPSLTAAAHSANCFRSQRCLNRAMWARRG
jgi:c-di-GMP-related signal transduction protein